MVLEFLGSGVDLSQAPEINEYSARYDADVSRYLDDRQVVDEPIRIQDELYIRDYDKCVLCYKCVEACGDDAQHTFAIAVAGRGFDNRISTEFDAVLPDSACVYCGNCVGGVPDECAAVHERVRSPTGGQLARGGPDGDDTVCSYCGVGCNLELHVQDNEIVKVTSPVDHSVTHGNLCIKGRFGYKYVGN